MWFLSYITTSPSIRGVFALSNCYYSQEFSWIELVRGKGMTSLFSLMSNYTQKFQSLTFSKVFSLFTFVFIFFLLFS
jgi:hypothetical protein